MQTALPVPESLPILNDLEQFESRSMHGQMPVVWDRAEDFQVFDRWGNTWIDYTSTIFVANAGHANPRIVKALREVIDHGLLHTYSYATEIRAKFLRRLIEVTPEQFDKAYLMSSGTEATEAVVKLMRMNGQRRGKRRLGIMSFEGAYHGRTQGAAMIGGTAAGRTWIGFEDPNVHQVPFPYTWSLKNGETGRDRFNAHLDLLRGKGLDLAKDLCGFMFEAYIGWAAAFIPTDYVQAAAEFAKANGILLGFDEVQGGFGRTGKMFVHEHYGVEPDLIATGKGISSSLPLSAVLGRKELLDLPDVGSMSSTHSANPLVCAAGLANLDEIVSRDLCGAAARMGRIMLDRLRAIQAKYPDRISHVIGEGMLAALIFKKPGSDEPDGLTASLICQRAMHKGVLLVHTGRESIKFGPPLTMPEDVMNEGMDVLEESIEEIIAEQAVAA
ncbi:MAG: aspartate aminotransferase family protein [Ferrovibrio sp.]|uniref:aspartate aminotransferase family protein n=1 Tax=Ferrovibrio sp. TaxID=1917215 RepID=UPI00391B520A